ncbi:MAG: GDSL family lipase [Lentisphaeria bacterium]|nr:GDSL family lipase [Lentisphaeria bacterium]
MKTIRVDASMMEGAVSLEEGDGWLKPWRLPFEDRCLFPPDDGLAARAEMAAGVRLRFRTDSRVVGVSVAAVSGPIPVDVTRGADLLASGVIPPGAEQVLFEDLPEGENTLEVWFGQTSVVRIRALLLEQMAGLSVPPDRRPRWITYGSSISHCGAAHSPARTWPATAARLRGLHLTCLGYGGQCHMEPMVARMIRDLPADFISLKLGINVCGAASLSPRTFRPAIIGMVRILRERHPLIPIAVISPIVSPPREDAANAVGLSLKAMRREVADAVKRLQDRGDGQVHGVDGLSLFDEAWIADYLPDLLHPNGDGYDLMGRRFAEVVIDPLLPGAAAKH